MTMSPRNVPLPECFNASKEYGNDKESAGALHAGVQARSSEVGDRRAEHRSGGKSLGVVEQTLFNWVKAERSGKLKGADSKVVSAEQMEISRLRAELARVKMERDILGKATAAQAACAEPGLSEVRLHPAPPARVANFGAMPGAQGQRGRVPRTLRAGCQHGPAAPPQR